MATEPFVWQGAIVIFADAAANIATALKSIVQGIVIPLRLTSFLIALPAMPVIQRKAMIPTRQPMRGASIQDVIIMEGSPTKAIWTSAARPNRWKVSNTENTMISCSPQFIDYLT